MNEITTPYSPGLYEHLLSRSLEKQLQDLPGQTTTIIQDVDSEDGPPAVAQYLERLIASSLSMVRGSDRAALQSRLVQLVLNELSTELGATRSEGLRLHDPLQRLLAIHQRHDAPVRPDTPLARSALLTGTRLDPSLSSQLSKEITTADRVDILCSFIRWSGFRLIKRALEYLTSLPGAEDLRLRVITTSYMGATDPRALDALCALPNTEVKVSYDTKRTRLHAKAYLIHRDSGFGSAYIGSANLSKAALSEGLEWTSKISQYELPYLWQKTSATFETYWNDDEFERYDATAASRLRDAIQRERSHVPQSAGDNPHFDLRPFPFQEEILDQLAAEREIQHKHRHLVVAATGTGKTMVSAFDYRRWANSNRPSLLFVAHREEILRQAMATFRAVLRDQNFGDLLVGGSMPQQNKHLFCSIQSYGSRDLCQLDPQHFEYVVIDEFHHAAAPTYRRLLDHVEPRILLGLTATPERTDGLDVLHWFNGVPSAEIRLPDAINRRLLCPFQYFGVSDSVDLSGLRWQRGGYRTDELNEVFTGNDIRAQLVLDKVVSLVLDPLRARGLGFCVSVDHAEFMAKYFSDRGIPSLALSARSSDEERREARSRLVQRSVNFIFVVDLYNEGVDIPEVDTVLFLRPTESLTIYLQQLGRGLRLHDDKDCLTVLDFIGSQRQEFRFASRFRALSTNPTGRLESEISNNFPHVPPGCSIELERVAQTCVLENVRQSLRLRRPKLIQDLRELARHQEHPPTIAETIDYLDTSLDELLKRGLWSRLLLDAGHSLQFQCPDEEQLSKGLRRLAHIDDYRQIDFFIECISQSDAMDDLDERGHRRLSMLHVTLWGPAGRSMSLGEANKRLQENPSALDDLKQILHYRRNHTQTRPAQYIGPLGVHAEYTRDEALIGLGHWDVDRRPEFREGVLHLPEDKADAFFVTLNKTESGYSPTTMYDDYAINDRLFHWQSQSTTSTESATGQRYVNHRQRGYTPLLFVRESKRLPSGLTSPYAFLGPARYVSHTGDRPMSIIWELESPIPARLRQRVTRGAVS